MDLIQIKNSGQEIVETNYYDTPHAASGLVYLSINAGALRLLVPDKQAAMVAEFRTGREVIVSRGPWPNQGLKDGLELLFEDESDNPYAIHMEPRQCDRLPGNADTGKRLTFAAWTQQGKAVELPCYCRQVKQIPWLKAYTGRR